MIVAVLQARTSSKRLPGKVLKPILAEPMLWRQIERISRARRVEKLVVATSVEIDDDAIADLCAARSIACFRGDLHDVLARFHAAAAAYSATHVVRLTGDCPLIEPDLIDQAIALHLQEGNDYTSNVVERSFPDGLDVEVFTRAALDRAHAEARFPSEREHVTLYINKQPKLFRLGTLRGPRDLSHWRWTVDNQEDFDLITLIYQALYPTNPAFVMADVLAFLASNPKLSEMNAGHGLSEDHKRPLAEDERRILERHGLIKFNDGTRYAASEALLGRALKVIPLGSQTFSKSYTQYPFGGAPFFATKAKGSRLFDVDGNEFIDFANSLAAVTLGYGDPDVTEAVKGQLEDGPLFTLAHPLEVKVAEKIVSMVPCAEMVRFGKNGSDATAGAIRLARAYTGRDRVAVCGYHGWQDWYIGSTARNRGVPEAVRALTHTFTYNEAASLAELFRRFAGQFAAVILEPMNVTYPSPRFLQEIKGLCEEHGALLVFDETITGFRFARGGAQEFFGVTPDLATFGKGIANGYPLAAVAGKAKYMQLMEEIFFSFTYGGEALSLAAAHAVLCKLERKPVIETLHRQGTKVLEGLNRLIEKHQITHFASTAGHPAWSFLIFRDAGSYSQWQIKTLYLQEVLARGVLTLGTHNMSYAHSDADVDRLLQVYDGVFPILKRAVDHRSLESMLGVKALEPLFKIR